MYIVFQVGCIECGVSSYPIKVCETLGEARTIQESHPDTWDSEGGDGFVAIYDLNTLEEVG